MKISTLIRKWTWELPQSIVGAVLWLYYKSSIIETGEYGETKAFFSPLFPGGISLGYFAFINLRDKAYLKNTSVEKTIKHECLGHGTQSKYLGPLYLPVIGLSSITWAGLYGSVIKPTKNGYYKFWTEKWADKLAGITRE